MFFLLYHLIDTI